MIKYTNSLNVEDAVRSWHLGEKPSKIFEAEKYSDEMDIYVVYAGEIVPKEVFENIKDYVVVFFAGATYLGNSYRQFMLAELTKKIKRKKVIIAIPEPRNQSINNWRDFYRWTKKETGVLYNQIHWELFWFGKSHASTMWIACYFDAKRATSMFLKCYKEGENIRPNSGITVWIEVGKFILEYVYRRKMGEKTMRLFWGAPEDVKSVKTTQHYLSWYELDEKDKKWYTLSNLDKSVGIPVSVKLLEDLALYINEKK